MNASSGRRELVVTLLLAAAGITCSGCPFSPSQSASTKGAADKVKQPLELLVVDDPQLGQAIAREWRARTEEELSVRDATIADIAKAQRLPGDAVIFPNGLIGQLVERGLIQPLADNAFSESSFDFRDIFDQIRLREMKWGDKTVAAPLGSPQLLLAYRVDVFEKLEIPPPGNWKAYNEAVQRLSDRSQLGSLATPADQPWRATVEPLADGWAGQLLLARAAAYALHRDQISPLFAYDSLDPLVAEPPYVLALEELSAAAKVAGFADQRLSPDQAMDELRAGRCAMAIGWPRPGGVQAGKETSPEVRFGFAMLPGAAEAYRFATKKWEERGEEDNPRVPALAVAGRMAAVSSGTADLRRAQGFVVWLARREVSNVVGPQSSATTLFRTSQIADAARWKGSLSPEAGRQYAEALAQTLSLPRAFPGLTLPGRLEYLAALDNAVQEAVNGKKTAKIALAEAAEQWKAITERLGIKGQRRASARSLGQEPL